MQALYAHAQNSNTDLAIGERELIRSIDKLYELFIYQLSFIDEIFAFSSKRTEDAKFKYLPTTEDLNPNTKFIDNKLIELIRDNADYRRNVDRYKISWFEDEEMVRNIFNLFKEGPEYKEYMASKSKSFKSDKEIVIKLFKKYIISYPNFESFCEEKNIYWANDYPVASGYLIKSLKLIEQDWEPLAPIPNFHILENKTEDLQFARTLFRLTLLKGKNYEQMISDRAKNWDLDRIALMDMIFLKMALTEFVEMPTIPIKVSFNEYIEISKEFSTPKSKTFINGILDKLIAELTEQKKIKKTGRGLME
jgi:N utilization substance protein B